MSSPDSENKTLVPQIILPIPEESFISTRSNHSEDQQTIQEEDVTAREPFVDALYDLFGDEVTQGILKPKIVSDTSPGFISMASTGLIQPKVVRLRPLNEKDRRCKFAVGRAYGAEALWRNIREDTWQELMQETFKDGEDVRSSAYEAFARECLVKKQVPPERSFVQDTSVKQLAEILRASQLTKIQNFRRKKRLMFKLANAHTDQYSILQNNNPLPELVDSNTEEAVTQFLPTWHGNMDASSSYMSRGSGKQSNRSEVTASTSSKHTKQKADYGDQWECSESTKGQLEFQSFNVMDSNHRQNVRPPSTREVMDNLGLSLDLTLLRKKPIPPIHLTQRYHFLRAEDNNPTGQFTSRFQSEFPNSNDPLESMTRKAQIGRQFTADHEQNRLASQRAVTGGRPILSHDRILKGESGAQSAPVCRMKWAPLSMGALAEYKTTRDFTFPIERDFRYGQMTVWKVDESNTVKA